MPSPLTRDSLIPVLLCEDAEGDPAESKPPLHLRPGRKPGCVLRPPTPVFWLLPLAASHWGPTSVQPPLTDAGHVQAWAPCVPGPRGAGTDGCDTFKDAG